MSVSLVVNNENSVKHKILQNLMDCDGKLVSVFHATRNIDATFSTMHELNSLVEDGLVERKITLTQNGLPLAWYRYKSELSLYRKLENSAKS